jgi:hypothetical protein
VLKSADMGIRGVVGVAIERGRDRWRRGKREGQGQEWRRRVEKQQKFSL